MLKYLLLVPVFSVFCGANGEDQELNLSCEQDWSPVGTNCLLFQEEALKAFCEEQDSKLIEFETSEQMVQFSEWFESSDYSVEKWWAGAERT